MAPSSPPSTPSVLRMAGPIMVSFWMRAAFTFVDTAFAATLGDDAVAGIGLAVPFEFLMSAAWVGMSTGLTSNLARAMGMHQGERILEYQRKTVRLILCVAPVFALIGAGIFLGAQHVGLEPGVAAQFRVYGGVLIGGSAFIAFWSVIPDSIVKAHQDTRSTMWAGIFSNVTNVTLNTVFLFVFHWGIFGIALSTVLGRISGLSYAIVRARFHEQRRIAAGADTVTGRDPHPYRAMFRLAIPAAITFGLMGMENGLINGLLARVPNPTEAIAAFSIYHRVTLFAIQPVIACGVAMLPYAAMRFGHQDLAGVRRGLREALAASLVYCVLAVTPILYFTAPPLAAWLAESPITTQYATFALRLAPVTCLAAVPFLLCRPVFEGMGRGTPGLWMAALRYLVLTVPCALIGMEVARRMDAPPLYGLIIGLIGVGALVSVAFFGWLSAVLRKDQGMVTGTVTRLP